MDHSYGTHKPFAPQHLNADHLTSNAVCVTLGKVHAVTPQPSLQSNSTYWVYFRISDQSGLAATSLANAEHCLGHMGGRRIPLDRHRTWYLYAFVTNASGTGANGGANDYLQLLAEV